MPGGRMYIQFDIDILSLLLLVIVLIFNLKNGNDGLFRQRFFRVLIFCNMGILLIDLMVFVLLNRPGLAVHIALMVLQSLFFALCALFCLFYALYCTIRPSRLKAAFCCCSARRCSFSSWRSALTFPPVFYSESPHTTIMRADRCFTSYRYVPICISYMRW